MFNLGLGLFCEHMFIACFKCFMINVIRVLVFVFAMCCNRTCTQTIVLVSKLIIIIVLL